MNKEELHQTLKQLLALCFSVEDQYSSELETIINDSEKTEHERAEKYLNFIIDKVIDVYPHVND